MEDSKKLIDNVSKMPAEAQQHPQVQADRSQAEQVLQEHVQKLESQKEPLSEAQKKELAEAKAALARLEPQRQAPTSDSTGKPRPAGEHPATTQPYRTIDASQEMPRRNGEAAERARSADTSQPESPHPSRTPPADTPLVRGAESSTQSRANAHLQESSFHSPDENNGVTRKPEDTTPYHPGVPLESPVGANPKTGETTSSGAPTQQGKNVPGKPDARPRDNSKPVTSPDAAPLPAATQTGRQPGRSSAAAQVQPSTPPMSVDQSQRLIENVSKMFAKAQQHAQVQADLTQAQRVVSEGGAGRLVDTEEQARDSQNSRQDDLRIPKPAASANAGAHVNGGKVQAAWKPSSYPEGSVNRTAADKWHKRLNALRNMTNPISAEQAISWHPEHPVTPDMKRKIYTAAQTILDMLPHDMVKNLGPVKLSVKPSLDENAAGEYDYMTDTMGLSHDKIKNFTPQELRGLLWHEMAHRLYYSAYLNPKAALALKEWRAKIDAHWAARTKGELVLKHANGWFCIRDGLISDYAGRLYPGQEGGVEIPSVYLEMAAWGPDRMAKLCSLFPSEEETFQIVLAIFKSSAP